jgi:tetratricopeptide (TPR) repeat protein
MGSQIELGPLSPASRGRPPLSQLWQVPAFLAGLAAVAAIVATTPFRHGPRQGEMERDLAAIRRALDGPGAAVERVVALAERVLARTDHEPARAGEVHFLLGSIYQRLAEMAPTGRAGALRDRALAHLVQAEQRGVPTTDRARLAYRLGKAWFLTGRAWQRAIRYLEPSVAEAADDPADGYRMLSQAYLHLPKPDLKGAYSASLKLLALPTDDEEVLGPARLTCGDIFLEQKKPAEALKMLETITSRAPAAVLARARYLQGLCCKELGAWDRAIPYWQEVLRDQRQAAARRSRVLYYLGQCYQHLDQADEAAKAWKQAMERRDENAQAAALCLAELYLAISPAGNLSNPTAALECYRRALARVTSPETYQNSFIDLNRARQRIGWACDMFRQYRDFESALELASLYRAIALPGAAEELQGRAAQDWARVLEVEPRPTRNPDATAWDEKIRSLYEKAGAAFEAAGGGLPAADQPRVLWASAGCFLRGHRYERAATVLEQYVRRPGVPESRCGEGWVTLAETQLLLGRKDRALEAYHKAIEYRGPCAFRARYQLALAEAEFKSPDAEEVKRHLRQAEALLKQNLDAVAGFESSRDVREQSQFLLGKLLFQQRAYFKAKLALETAVDQYPNNPEIFLARERLADCFRRMADESIERINNPEIKGEAQIYHRQQKNQNLEQAAGQYLKLADDLDRRRTANGLTLGDQALLRRVVFAAADCRFDQDNMTNEAYQLFKALAEKRYAGRVESLAAYQNMWRCACRMDQPETARAAARDAWLALEKLPDTELGLLTENVFRGSPGPLSRADWKKWLTWMGDQLPRPAGK